MELFLLIVVFGLNCLLWQMAHHGQVVLHLFYLPVVLAGFFLGRYLAGILSLMCVVSVSVLIMSDVGRFAGDALPVLLFLLIATWGAILGLAALLVGTLSDERTSKMMELHEAYLGVVEVLSHYLQCANPKLKVRSNRVAELAQLVARQLKLPDKEIDDIRVAALLQDLENLEITARVIRKAVGDLESDQQAVHQYTFHGTELVKSLGSVLTGALPLVMVNSCMESEALLEGAGDRISNVPSGVRIIQTARAFDRMIYDHGDKPVMSRREALNALYADTTHQYDAGVLAALERAINATRADTKRLAAQETSPSFSSISSDTGIPFSGAEIPAADIR